MSFKTEAFVLRSRTWHQADRMYDLFTPQEGIINVVLKSAAKAGNKLSGHLLPFSKVRVMIGRGRLDHMAGVETLNDYSNVRLNLRNLFLASSIVELFLAEDRGSQKKTEFKLLDSIFSFLNDESVSPERKLLLVRIFLWKYLSVAGWQPELEECLICQKKVSTGKYMPGRGIICREHTDRGGIQISDELLDFLRHIISADWHQFNNLEINNNLNKEWLKLSSLFYQTVYERPSRVLKLFAYG